MGDYEKHARLLFGASDEEELRALATTFFRGAGTTIAQVDVLLVVGGDRRELTFEQFRQQYGGADGFALPAPAEPNGVRVARAFHESYERQAADFGYKTREASAKPWDEVPEANRLLMCAVVEDLLATGVIEALPVDGPTEPGPARLARELDEQPISPQVVAHNVHIEQP